MAVNTSTYGIPYNCKNWLALASVVWGNLDTSEAITGYRLVKVADYLQKEAYKMNLN